MSEELTFEERLNRNMWYSLLGVRMPYPTGEARKKWEDEVDKAMVASLPELPGL